MVALQSRDGPKGAKGSRHCSLVRQPSPDGEAFLLMELRDLFPKQADDTSLRPH